jgi:hypothetical protein
MIVCSVTAPATRISARRGSTPGIAARSVKDFARTTRATISSTSRLVIVTLLSDSGRLSPRATIAIAATVCAVPLDAMIEETELRRISSAA